jgi:hypothetical protein
VIRWWWRSRWFRESSGTTSGCYTASPLGACVAAIPVSKTAYPITVGGGGARWSYYPGVMEVWFKFNFSTITSTGGGGGNSTPNGAG